MTSRSTVFAAAAALAVVAFGHAAQAVPSFPSATAWGTLGVLQTENIPQCNLNGLFGSATSGFAQYPAHLATSVQPVSGAGQAPSSAGAGSGLVFGPAAQGFAIDYSAAATGGTTATYGASLQFQPSGGTAVLLVAGAGSTTGPVVVTSVQGNFGGGSAQQGGITYLNIAFFYTANGVACGAQITGTFFAVPIGG